MRFMLGSDSAFIEQYETCVAVLVTLLMITRRPPSMSCMSKGKGLWV